MSTEMVSIQERIKAELAGLKDSVAPPSGRTIRIQQNKTFQTPDGKTSQGPLSVVILDHRSFNSYYTKRYDPNNPAPPDCFAIAKIIAELAPHEEAADPQAESCAECPMNQWGSAATGKGKACRNQVRLAVAAADATPSSEPMILRVSPTALKSWNGLVNDLESIGRIPLQMVTEISFDQNLAYPSLLFQAVEEHDRLEEFWRLREKAQALLDQPPATGG